MTVQDVYNAFQKKARNSVVLYSIGKKIEAGTATMEDAAKYNATISTILGKVIGDNILKIPESERVKFLHWILQEQYKDTNERLAVIQKFLDKHTGIDLEPQKAPFPKERVQQLGTSLTDHTVPDETIQRRARAGSANIATSFHNDYVKENAKFRSNAGMKCYLERKVSGKCCPWCRALAGRYVYGSEPADLFRRHDNCTCQVTYESGRTRQNVWTKKTWEERPAVPETPKPTVFSHEQAKQTEAEALLKLGLTKDKKSGRIKSLDIDDFELMAQGRNIDEKALSVISDVIKRYEKAGEMYINDFYFGSLPKSETGQPLLQIEPVADRTIRLNINTDIFSGHTVDEINSMIASSEFILAQNIEEAVIHECGHAKSIYRMTLSEIRQFYSEIADANIQGISDLAATDGAEALAEIEILLARGETVPEQAMSFYQKYMNRGK